MMRSPSTAKEAPETGIGGRNVAILKEQQVKEQQERKHSLHANEIPGIIIAIAQT